MLSKRLKKQTEEIIKPGVGKKGSKNFFRKHFSLRSSFGRKFYIFLFTFAVIVSVLSYNFTPDLGIKLGESSPRTVKANKSISFEDPLKTEEDRNKRELEVQDIYKYDTSVLNGKEGVLYQIRYFFELAKVVSKKQEKTYEEKINYLADLLNDNYDDSILGTALNLSFSENSLLMNKALEYARSILSENIRPNDVDLKKSEIEGIISRDTEIMANHKQLITQVISFNIKPTAVFDPTATDEARVKAREETPPHLVTIDEGQTIINEGDIAGETDILVLTKLGLLNQGFNWRIFSLICLLNIVTLLLFYLYLFKYNKKTFDNDKSLLINSTIIIIFIALIKLFTILSSLHLNLWLYLFPLIAASMLATIIFDTRVGIMLTLILAVNFGIAANFDYQMALIYFLGGTFSTFMVSNISQRSTIMRGGFFSSLFLALLFFTINLAGGDIKTISLYTVLGIVNGVIAAILTIGMLPFIESSFRIITAMGLLELSHSDQPLLKELLINAPGTYNHSMLVSHLAESGANAIGADALLVKVAALYHDLGKMKRPEYFYENQQNVENIHDKLNPSMSKNIISSHIKDGVEIAIKNKIPKKVIEIISQHHGNSVITYFLKKQKNMDTAGKPLNSGTEGIMEGHFRYLSKKPQSKEAAILMLADSAEASVRSIEKITPKKIEQMVNDIVKSKIDDQQLSEADITIREINTVKNSLIDGLISIYHSRISYQDLSANPLVQA